MNDNAAIRHDTPHPAVPDKFLMHVSLVRDRRRRWVCGECGCPHESVPAPRKPGDAPSSYLVASEARRCPASFEHVCKDCGNTYECKADCAGVLGVLAGARIDPDVYVAGEAGGRLPPHMDEES